MSTTNAIRPARTTMPDTGISALTLLLLAVVTSFGALSMDLYLPGLPSLQRDLGATSAQAQLTVTACIAGLAAGQLLCGVLGDMVGRRRPMLIGGTVWVAATVACSTVDSVSLLLLLRVLQGFAAGIGIALTRSVIADRDPEGMVGHLARMFLVLAAVPIAAPTLGAVLIEGVGWRNTFLVLAGVGSLYVLAMAVMLEETLPRNRRTPLALRSAGATFSTLLGSRSFVRGALASGLALGVMFTYIGCSALVFRDGFGLSAVQYGLLFGANAVALVIGIQLAAPLTRRLGAPRTLLTGGSAGVLAAAVMLVLSRLAPHSLLGAVVPLAFVLMAAGVLMPAASASAMTTGTTTLPGSSGVMGAVQFGVGGGAGGLAAALAGRPSSTEFAVAALTCLGLATLLSGAVRVRRARPAELPSAVVEVPST